MRRLVTFRSITAWLLLTALTAAMPLLLTFAARFAGFAFRTLTTRAAATATAFAALTTAT